jgi:hypothetical protein
MHLRSKLKGGSFLRNLPVRKQQMKLSVFTRSFDSSCINKIGVKAPEEKVAYVVKTI